MKKIILLIFLMVMVARSYGEGSAGAAFHKVARGETLTEISVRYNMDIEDIKEINNIRGEDLKAGEKIYLEFPSYKERWIEVDTREIKSIGSSRRKIKGRAILNMDKKERVEKTVEDIYFAWPIDWEGATSEWGYRTDPLTGEKMVKHSGIDLKAGMNTPVYSPADGVVRVAEWWNGYGRLVIIDHHSGYSTRFAHLSGYSVEAGEAIKRGELIGKSGSSGRSTGPHLHFEVRKNEVAINPLNFREGEAAAGSGKDAAEESVKDSVNKVAMTYGNEEMKNLK